MYANIDTLFAPVAIAVAGGEETTEVVYGLTSQPPEVASPAQLLQQVQTHWQIETRLHGRRDGSLQEDRALVRMGQATHVQAVLNNTVVGLFLKHQYANMAAGRRELDATQSGVVSAVPGRLTLQQPCGERGEDRRVTEEGPPR